MSVITFLRRISANRNVGCRGLTEHCCKVSLVGRLDLATSPGTRQVVGNILTLGRGIVKVDLSELEFIDAAGMRVLLQAHRVARRQGRALLLVGVAPRTQRLLKILWLDEMIRGSAERAGALVVPEVGVSNARDSNAGSVEELAPFKANGVTWTRTA